MEKLNFLFKQKEYFLAVKYTILNATCREQIIYASSY